MRLCFRASRWLSGWISFLGRLDELLFGRCYLVHCCKAGGRSMARGVRSSSVGVVVSEAKAVYGCEGCIWYRDGCEGPRVERLRF